MILSPYKASLKRGYVDQEFYIEDTSLTSPNYFDITEFPDYIGGGKSVIKIKGAGLGLKFGTPIEAEVLDIDGNVVYSEFPDFIDKFNNIYLSIYVYDFVTKGVGSISLVSTAEYDPDGDLIPEDLQDSLNLRWTRDILILPDFRNNSIIDFAKGPTISVAQTITPFRVATAFTSSLIQETTSSIINYVSTDPVGYDFDQSTVDDVLDETLNNILINPNETSRTANIVFSPPRIKDYDITNGFLLRENTRFNTYIYSSESFFKKEMTGGQFTFLSQPSSSFPQLPTGSTLVTSLENQLTAYAGNIVKVVDQHRALIDKPVRVGMTIPDIINNQTSSFKYTKLEAFTSSIVYKPIDLTFITSSNVSQSYVQFTMDDVDPIAGQVYRIKTFYKTSGQTGDYKLMADQYIRNIEVLSDPSRPNQVPYAKSEGDYYLIGYFTDITKVATDPLNLFSDVDWKSYYESPTAINTATCTTSSQYLSDAAVLSSSYNNSATFIFTTAAWQAYSINKIYTLTFNCCLEPGVELELYANSTELNTETSDLTGFGRAFLRTENKEKTRYDGNFNRFGKFIGSIKNNYKSIKNYGRVVFDFEADSDGIGRPLFRLKYKDSSDGVGYISDVSIKPQQIQGFTPSLIQYAIPVETDFAPILSQSIDFKFEYYDYTGNQSEFVSYLKDVRVNLAVELPTLGCQSEKSLHDFPVIWKDTTTEAVLNQTSLGFPVGSTNGAPNGSLTAAAAQGKVAYYNQAAYLTQQGDFNTTIITNWNTNQFSSAQYPQSYDWIPGPISVNQILFGPTFVPTSSWVIFDENVAAEQGAPVPSYVVDYPNLEATSSIDGRYFTYGPACCIDKRDVNSNIALFESNGGFDGTSAPQTQLYMKQRLFWPRMGTPTDTQTNKRRPGYFTENGGIYQVSFKVKTYSYGSTNGGSTEQGQDKFYYTPDSGSFLRVFIHNVYSNITSGTPAFVGADGNYPPQQNITTITFDQNTQWVDGFSGHRYAQFSTTLVQYGSFAQICFEAGGTDFNTVAVYNRNNLGRWTNAGGSLIFYDTKAFGGCIDDIQICKIGRTTDPYYIKPETIGGTIKPGTGVLNTRI
jgi:hypothetical protein